MKVFVKFGQEKYLRRTLLYNRLYFGIAKEYKKIETDQLIKGQGDNKEATMVIKGVQSARMVHYQTGQAYDLPEDSVIEVINGEAACIPVYCISLLDTDRDCVLSDGKLLISPSFMKTIRSHFPNANAALVFANSETVRKAFENTFSTVRMQEITYPWMSEKGSSIEYIEQIMTELSERDFNSELPDLLAKCKMSPNDGSPVRFFATTKKDAYKILFCKDPYFSEEREYRFLLPNVRLPEHGQEYLLRGIPKTQKQLLSLDDFEYNLDFNSL